MQQVVPVPDARIRINPVQNPEILPVSFAMPLVTTRFASPAASLCVTPSLLDWLFRKK